MKSLRIPFQELYTYTTIALLILSLPSCPHRALCILDQLILFFLLRARVHIRRRNCVAKIVISDDEEDEFNSLREELRRQRRMRKEVEAELEKERNAATSAADEMMAKILELRTEKAMVEREAREYREIAEQKRVYDKEVIEDLKWIVSNFGNGNGKGGEERVHLE